MTIIPFVFLVLAVLIIPTSGVILTAYAGIDTSQEVNEAQTALDYQKIWTAFASGCANQITSSQGTPQQAQIIEECSTVIREFNTQMEELGSTHGDLLDKYSGNIAGRLIGDFDPDRNNEDNNNDVDDDADPINDSPIGNTPGLIMPGGDVDQTFDNDPMPNDGPVAPDHGSTNNQQSEDNQQSNDLETGDNSASTHQQSDDNNEED